MPTRQCSAVGQHLKIAEKLREEIVDLVSVYYVKKASYGINEL
jgi:hypothetical protein